MPFAVFRRHQKKMLAIIAILAMTGFVLSDVAFRLSSGLGAGARNTTVVELYKRPVKRSDLQFMQIERNYANLFMAQVYGRLARVDMPHYFGETTAPALVDALILQHEADRLGLPAGSEVGSEWLKRQLFGPRLTNELFESILGQFNDRISGEDLLAAIANQARLQQVRSLQGMPVVTPLDVFQAYRDQTERVSVRAVAFPVDDFVSQVGDPSTAEIQAYYDLYKGQLPDPNRPTPGFKVPRLIQVEVLALDGAALTREIQAKLTEADLRTYYENRKNDFKVPSPKELPEVIFAEQGSAKAADLTPPQIQTFAEVRPYLPNTLAEERAQAEIVEKFRRIKEDVLDVFVDDYYKAEASIEEAKKAGEKPTVSFPAFQELTTLVEKEGLKHRITKLMSREEAERDLALGGAEAGLTRLSGGHKFAEELFDTRTTLYDAIEMTNFSGERFLLRKLADQAPHVPQREEIRADVVLAWKKEKARAFAQFAADALAAKLKTQKGKIAGDMIDGRRVIVTDPITRLQPGLPLPGRYFESGPPTPTEIPQIPGAGPEIRDAYFGLGDGEVAVAPNEPKTVYYTMALDRRVEASFAVLFAPNGDYPRYRNEAAHAAIERRDTEWMNELRAQAGLKPGWVPLDEAKDKEKGKDRDMNEG
jgi:hypothetical protein